MQGTIASFDLDTGGGTLLLDDGTELAFDTAAFEKSGLRQLRPGQRVTVDAEPAGRVHRVGIPGIT